MHYFCFKLVFRDVSENLLKCSEIYFIHTESTLNVTIDAVCNSSHSYWCSIYWQIVFYFDVFLSLKKCIYIDFYIQGTSTIKIPNSSLRIRKSFIIWLEFKFFFPVLSVDKLKAIFFNTFILVSQWFWIFMQRKDKN